MEKQSQPMLVIWVGLMLVVMIGIGIVSYVTRTAPTGQIQSQTAASRGTSALDNTYIAAALTRTAPAGRIQSRPAVTQNKGALDTTYHQLSDETNKITVSIYDGKNGPG